MTPLQAALSQVVVGTAVAAGVTVALDVVAPPVVAESEVAGVVDDELLDDDDVADVPRTALTMASTIDNPADTHISTSSVMPTFLSTPICRRAGKNLVTLSAEPELRRMIDVSLHGYHCWNAWTAVPSRIEKMLMIRPMIFRVPETGRAPPGYSNSNSTVCTVDRLKEPDGESLSGHHANGMV